MKTTPLGGTTCEFCSELQGSVRTRFHDIYASVLSSRIVANCRHFVALPTLGQLVPRSLLVIPRRHVETFAQLTDALRVEAFRFIEELEARLERCGDVFIFEHGAQSGAGGGCGIYHAHLHLVPLPRPLMFDELIKHVGQTASTLLEAWRKLDDCSEYLAVKDSCGSVFYSVADQPGGFGSQYCRRRIAECLNLDRPWDWRAYDSVEPWLLETVEMLRTADQGVADSCRF